MSARDGVCAQCYTELVPLGGMTFQCPACGWRQHVDSKPVGNVGHDEVAIQVPDLVVLLNATTMLSDRSMTMERGLRGVINRTKAILVQGR